MKWTDKVLWQRARDWLTHYRPLVVGIAGSIGKTTTKKAIGLALGEEKNVYVPKRAYKNPKGVAAAILGLEEKRGMSWFSLLTRSVVKEVEREEPNVLLLELGAEKPGEVDQVVQEIPIHIAVVTNVGMRHLDLFSEKENVAHEIESIVAQLPEDGIAVLNMDDELVAPMAGRTKANVITYGASQNADVRVVRFERFGAGGFVGEISVHGRSYELSLPQVVSRHQLSSVLAAVAVAHILKLDIALVVKRLQSFVPPAGRSHLKETKRGWKIIDSSFDVTPDSVMSDLGTLRALKAKRKVAVLTDMPSLGRFSDGQHKKVGKFAGEVAGIVVGVGTEIRAGLVEASKQGVDVHQFQTTAEASKWLNQILRAGDLVLVAGERNHNFAEIVERIS